MEDRRQFWRGHVAAFEASGETQKLYCERRGLVPKTLRTWRARLRGRPDPAITDGATPAEGDQGGAREFFSPSPAAGLDRASLVELFTSAQTRRRWTAEEKQGLVVEALRSGVSIERFARRSGVAPSVLYRWRQELALRIQDGPDPLSPAAPQPAFASVRIAPPPGAPEPAPDAADRDAGMVEAILTNGRRLRFHVRTDPAALRHVIAALEAAP